MNKKSKKESLLDAIVTLKKAIAEYEKCRLESSRDGVIQRFEYCTDLSWEAVRDYLVDEGFYGGFNSPKSTMRKAFSYGMISDEQAWIALLQDRSLTSHLYDQEKAEEIYQRIKSDYTAIFDNLADFLNK